MFCFKKGSLPKKFNTEVMCDVLKREGKREGKALPRKSKKVNKKQIKKTFYIS